MLEDRWAIVSFITSGYGGCPSLWGHGQGTCPVSPPRQGLLSDKCVRGRYGINHPPLWGCVGRRPAASGPASCAPPTGARVSCRRKDGVPPGPLLPWACLDQHRSSVLPSLGPGATGQCPQQQDPSGGQLLSALESPVFTLDCGSRGLTPVPPCESRPPVRCQRGQGGSSVSPL